MKHKPRTRRTRSTPPTPRTSRKTFGPASELKLILASASPRRAALLQELGWPFVVKSSQANEVAPGFLSPAEAAQANASRKALAVARHHPDSLVLGADTMVWVDGVHLGKPASLAEAEAMLVRLQGRVHQVATGICLIHWSRGRRRLFAETTAVTFRPLTRTQIRDYLRSIQPLDKAGGYAIQERGGVIVESIQGSYTNVVGLPLERLQAALAEWRERAGTPGGESMSLRNPANSLVSKAAWIE